MLMDRPKISFPQDMAQQVLFVLFLAVVPHHLPHWHVLSDHCRHILPPGQRQVASGWPGARNLTQRINYPFTLPPKPALLLTPLTFSLAKALRNRNQEGKMITNQSHKIYVIFFFFFFNNSTNLKPNGGGGGWEGG